MDGHGWHRYTVLPPNTCVRTHAHTRTHTHTYTHLHTLTHTYTHTCTCTCSYLLREDMYNQAVGLLPVVLQDMGDLVERKVEGDDRETVLTVSKCAYNKLLTQVCGIFWSAVL